MIYTYEKYRRRAGLTQEKVAQHLGIRQSAVAQWESGKSTPTLKNVKKLATLFHCSVDDLLSDLTGKDGEYDD